MKSAILLTKVVIGFWRFGFVLDFEVCFMVKFCLYFIMKYLTNSSIVGIGCIWRFGFVSVLSLFCMLPF
jgi:hypothetical protein